MPGATHTLFYQLALDPTFGTISYQLFQPRRGKLTAITLVQYLLPEGLPLRAAGRLLASCPQRINERFRQWLMLKAVAERMNNAHRQLRNT